MAYASKQTLDETNLSTAISAMKRMKADNGELSKPAANVCLLAFLFLTCAKYPTKK